MASYIKDTLVERTVSLNLAGTPSLGVLPADVNVQYKKAGQSSFQALAVNSTNWLEIGDGYYTLLFSPAVMDTAGTFVFTATGSGFDNQVFDQFNIVDDTLAGDQQAYFQDAPSERTVYLELSGTPATALLPAAVTVQYKKAGQIGFLTKILDVNNWINLGAGYYTIKFTSGEMSRVGTFIYTLAGAGFDNFAYDEFVILAAPDTSVKDKCILKGQFIGLAGSNPNMNIRVSARPVDFPARTGNRIVSAEEIYTFLDHEGKFELPLLRGSTCIIEVPRAAIRHQVNIPDTDTAELTALLPPFAVDYTL